MDLSLAFTVFACDKLHCHGDHWNRFLNLRSTFLWRFFPQGIRLPGPAPACLPQIKWNTVRTVCAQSSPLPEIKIYPWNKFYVWRVSELECGWPAGIALVFWCGILGTYKRQLPPGSLLLVKSMQWRNCATIFVVVNPSKTRRIGGATRTIKTNFFWSRFIRPVRKDNPFLKLHGISGSAPANRPRKFLLRKPPKWRKFFRLLSQMGRKTTGEGKPRKSAPFQIWSKSVLEEWIYYWVGGSLRLARRCSVWGTASSQ